MGPPARAVHHPRLARGPRPDKSGRGDAERLSPLRQSDGGGSPNDVAGREALGSRAVAERNGATPGARGRGETIERAVRLREVGPAAGCATEAPRSGAKRKSPHRGVQEGHKESEPPAHGEAGPGASEARRTLHRYDLLTLLYALGMPWSPAG